MHRVYVPQLSFPFVCWWASRLLPHPGYYKQCCDEHWGARVSFIGKTLSDINHSKILYDPPPRILEIKAKINKWDLIKLKIFCTTKETINKVKRQPSDWEKIIANKATDKGLISKIYKQLLQLNSRKLNDTNQKMGQRSKQTFLQRRHTDG